MNQRIIYTNDDGGVAVIVPAPECELTIEEIAAKDVPAGKTYEIVDVSAIPSDRTFRNAWVKNGATVDHDIPKCKEIAHVKRREKRAAEFAPHDEVIRLGIPGVDGAAAEAARAQIRAKYSAMQAAIAAATSVDGIKAALE